METDRDTVSLTMNRQGSVSGILVDEEGAPIAGSRVAVGTSRRFGLLLMRTPFDDDRTRTDADGRFTVHGVDPGDNKIVATGDSHVEASQDVDVRPGEATTDVRLVALKGATLRVTVTDRHGAPVAQAEVRVEPTEDHGNFTIKSGGMHVSRKTKSVFRGRRGRVEFFAGGARHDRATTGPRPTTMVSR